MVGQLALDQRIGVRLPASQPPVFDPAKRLRRTATAHRGPLDIVVDSEGRRELHVAQRVSFVMKSGRMHCLPSR